MRKLRFPFLVAALCLAGAAFAQATSPAAPPAPVGPFPPQPGGDPSLYRTLPQEAYPPAPGERRPSSPPQAAPGRSPAPGAEPARTPAATPPVVVVVPATSVAVQPPPDAAQLEAEAARTPPRINGEFTGETDERFR